MRVLMTTDTIGGVWTFTQQLSEELLRQGHSVGIVSVGRSPTSSQQAWCQSHQARYGSHFQFAACPGPLEWMQENEQAYDAAAPSLLAVTRAFAPDVLLSSQYCFGALPIDIPKVIVAHSDVLSWAQACRGCSLPQTPWLKRYVRLVSQGVEGATAVVAPTHWMQSALNSNFTLPQHTVVIPNGRSVPKSEHAPKRQHQAVTAGRFWDEAKNLHLLETRALPMPVVVAGAIGEGGSQRQGESITLRGELSEAELLALFHESEIYICSSIYEPFGLAPLEAALCGCAVLANDIPSLREVWGECATFFRGAEDLANRLRELSNGERLREAQRRALARAEMFTPQRMTDRYVHLFERLLDAQHACARSAVHAA